MGGGFLTGMSVLVGLVGLLVASQVNRGIYRLAWNPQLIGPWLPRRPGMPVRRWNDFIPVLGWWFLRREEPIHGRAYWLRPMLIEVALAAGLVWLFRWELQGGLWPLMPGLQESTAVSGVRFVFHTLLISLMTVATFIDIDEKTIPDSITIPGTLLGLIGMTIWPQALLPDVGAQGLMPLWLTSPEPWKAWLDSSWGLGVGIVCWSGWCYGLQPKTWFTRYGWTKALRYLCASIRRHPWTKIFVGTWVVGSLAVVGIWTLGGLAWQGLLTSLVGLAYGGGIVWAVRIVGTAVLKREAMGFGDVTLMAMVGSFLGWQPALIIFFMAPFAGALLAIVQRFVFGRDDIAYGPFLCLATLIVMLLWRDLWWGQLRDIFSLGWILNLVLAFCMVLMGVVLAIYQMLLGLLRRPIPSRAR